MRLLAGLWSLFMTVYIIVAMAAVPYYNWQYARTHGLGAWLTFGQIIPTMKAFSWPLWGFNSEEPDGRGAISWTDEEKANFEHFHASAAARQGAVRISNLGGPGIVDEAGLSEIRELNCNALEQARLVRDDVLEKALAGMSGPFRQKYQRGLELVLRNLEVGDIQAELEGSRLLNEWVDWMNAHRRAARFPRR